jgi:hypothetical protein
MNYQDSKKFYKDQWHSPFGRARKVILPILVSGIAVLLIGGISLALIPYLVWATDLSEAPMTQLLTSVAIGTIIALISFKLKSHRNSQFQLIKVKISNPRRHHD